MKAVILAGGYGTRLSEETKIRPKPMVEIGGIPMIMHIMGIYAKHGITDFIVCCGYKGEYIKDYFANYAARNADFTINLKTGAKIVHTPPAKDWNITLVDTGLDSMTGGRLKRIADYVKEDDCFCATYGDGVSDIDITASIAQHKKSGAKATLAAVYPEARFGRLNIENGMVTAFEEKPKTEAGRINGGFFVLSPSALDYITDDSTIWERAPMETLAKNGELCAYEHDGFWKPMDSLRDKEELEAIWESGNVPWV